MGEAMCGWNYDELDAAWITDCGNLFVFVDGFPSDNGFDFCPYCGRKLADRSIQQEESDAQ